MWSGSQQAPGYSIRNGLAMIHTYQTKQQESSKDPSFFPTQVMPKAAICSINLSYFGSSTSIKTKLFQQLNQA
jgi:hypothetical protein